jgi:hypothetical protein
MAREREAETMAAFPRGSPERLAQAALAEGIEDLRVLEALRRVRREPFVPPAYRGRAYDDEPAPIPEGQVTTQPTLVARMVEALRLRGDERVLEVGTGLGYQAAVLAQLCREVFTIERFAVLAAEARRNLLAANIANVTVVHGDGALGLPAHLRSTRSSWPRPRRRSRPRSWSSSSRAGAWCSRSGRAARRRSRCSASAVVASWTPNS